MKHSVRFFSISLLIFFSCLPYSILGHHVCETKPVDPPALLATGPIKKGYIVQPGKAQHHFFKVQHVKWLSYLIPPEVKAIGTFIVSLFLWHTAKTEEEMSTWSAQAWRTYFEKKCKDYYGAQFIEHVLFYPGYEHQGFCDFLTELDCEDCFFAPLENFIERWGSCFGAESQNEFELYLSALKNSEQEEIILRMRRILDTRAQRTRQRRLREQEKAKEKQEKKERDELLIKLSQEQLKVNACINQYRTQPNEYTYVPSQFMKQRLKHYDANVSETSSAFLTKSYTLTSRAQQALVLENKHPNGYLSCTGIPLQQFIHGECISLIEEVSAFKPTALRGCAIDAGDLGYTFNRHGYCASALRALDVGWSIREVLQTYAKAGNKFAASIIAQVQDQVKSKIQAGVRAGMAIGHGLGEGVVYTACDITALLCNPEDWAHEWAKSLKSSGAALGAFVKDHPPLCILLAQGRLLSDDRPSTLEEELLYGGHVFTTYVEEHPYEALRYGSHAITQGALNHAIGNYVGGVFTKSAKRMPVLLKNLMTLGEAVVEEDVMALVALEDEHLSMVASGTAQTIKKGTGAASSALKKSPAVAPVVNVLRTAQELAQDLAHLMKPLQQELPYLRSLFDGTRKGFGTFANKFLKFSYEHFLGIEYTIDKRGMFKWSGFHHDFMGAIEKSGLVKFINKVVREDGFYKAFISIDGVQSVPKSFFPQHWTRQQVMNAILEAYDNFVTTGAQAILSKDGKFCIKGFTREGIELEMYITQKGLITSVYPILG